MQVIHALTQWSDVDHQALRDDVNALRVRGMTNLSAAIERASSLFDGIAGQVEENRTSRYLSERWLDNHRCGRVVVCECVSHIICGAS